MSRIRNENGHQDPQPKWYDRWLYVLGDRLGVRVAEVVSRRVCEPPQSLTVDELAMAVEAGNRAARKARRVFVVVWWLVLAAWFGGLIAIWFVRMPVAVIVEVDRVDEDFEFEAAGILLSNSQEESSNRLRADVERMVFDFDFAQVLEIELPASQSDCASVADWLGGDAECDPSGILTGVSRLTLRPTAGSTAPLVVRGDMQRIDSIEMDFSEDPTFGTGVAIEVDGDQDIPPRLRVLESAGFSGMTLESGGRHLLLELITPGDTRLVVQLGTGNPNSGIESALVVFQGLKSLQVSGFKTGHLRIGNARGDLLIDGRPTELPRASVHVESAGGSPLDTSLIVKPELSFAKLNAESARVQKVIAAEANLVPNVLQRAAALWTIIFGALGAGLFATVPHGRA